MFYKIKKIINVIVFESVLKRKYFLCEILEEIVFLNDCFICLVINEDN